MTFYLDATFTKTKERTDVTLKNLYLIANINVFGAKNLLSFSFQNTSAINNQCQFPLSEI